jgi:hypothetical protein
MPAVRGSSGCPPAYRISSLSQFCWFWGVGDSAGTGVPTGQQVLMGVRGGEEEELDVVSAGASGARDLG